MKKSIIYLGLLTLLMSMSSFTSKNEIAQEVLEKSLNLKALNKYLEKDEAGEVLPIILITNDHFPRHLNFRHEGTKVMLFPNTVQTSLPADTDYLNVSKFNVGKKQTVLKFKYQGKRFKIKLRKVNGEWVYKSFSVRGDGVFHKDVDITF